MQSCVGEHHWNDAFFQAPDAFWCMEFSRWMMVLQRPWKISCEERTSWWTLQQIMSSGGIRDDLRDNGFLLSEIFGISWTLRKMKLWMRSRSVCMSTDPYTSSRTSSECTWTLQAYMKASPITLSKSKWTIGQYSCTSGTTDNAEDVKRIGRCHGFVIPLRRLADAWIWCKAWQAYTSPSL